MRIYLPATLELLRAWHASATVPASRDRYVAGGEDEDSEYAALMTAADGSAALLDGPGRRVVVVADVDDADGEVAWWQVASVHADADVRPVGADADEDLSWYAPQEVAALLGA